MKCALAGMLIFVVSGAVASMAPAAGSAGVSVIGASIDEYGSYTVSVADSRPGSTLVLYVDGRAPSRATVNRRQRAVFRYVELEGVGKLSFAEVRKRKRGGRYTARLGYVRYFDVTAEHVSFSSTAPPKVEAPEPSTPTPPTTPTPQPPVCLNGTYVNSEGHTVCKPEESPEGPPAGATARCRDGSYSFSEHRSGTCSSHGGVAEWL